MQHVIRTSLLILLVIPGLRAQVLFDHAGQHPAQEARFDRSLALDDFSLFGKRKTPGFHYMAVGSSDPFFHRSYLVDGQGQVVDRGFAPSGMFFINHNPVVFAGLSEKFRDSLNPYGSVNIQQALVTGTLNTIFTGLRKSRQ
jgi:hypothetical protein